MSLLSQRTSVALRERGVKEGRLLALIAVGARLQLCVSDLQKEVSGIPYEESEKMRILQGVALLSRVLESHLAAMDRELKEVK